MTLIKELKRRNVFKVTFAYIVMSWLVLQVADVILNNITAPEWIFKVLMLFLAIGLPFAVFFSWAFELTPEGLKREREVDRTQSITPQTGKKLNLLITVVLVVALGYFAIDKFVLSSTREQAAIESAVSQATSQAVTDKAAAAESDKSIAVLPFVNMSDDKSNEYFGDGLAEELLNLLAKVPDLKVAARTSSFHFKGKDPTLAEVAAALQVDTVLEGSVRRSGETIRVVAQLINTTDGSHMWSEKYDRPLTDLFAVQDDIASKIVGALMPHLGAEQAKLATSDTGDISPALFERYMRARHRFYDKTPTAIAYAHGEFQAITTAAPAYSPAWGWLARTWIASCKCSGGEVEEAIAYAHAEEAIDTAFKLNPDEPLALVAQAQLLRRKDKQAESLPVYDRAIALDPMLVDAHIGRERTLARLGRADEAIQGLEQARAIDPLHPEVLYDLAHLLNLQKRTRDAFVAVEQLYAINPANARELEAHLYGDNNEVGRALFLSEHIFREGGKEVLADQLGQAFLALGQPAHPAVAASGYAAAGLAREGKRDEALARLQTLPVTDDTLDERVTARIALGDLEVARDLLWQNWQGLEQKEISNTFPPGHGVLLVSLLQETGRAADAEEPLLALEALFKLFSRLHSAGYDWFAARLALARGDLDAAIAAFARLAEDGSVGDRSAGGIDPLLGDLAKDTRMQPVIERFDANLATQTATLERLRASGMSVEAARREYVAGLSQ